MALSLWTRLKLFIFTNAKVKIADVVQVLEVIDANHDGEITAGELVEVVLGLTKG